MAVAQISNSNIKNEQTDSINCTISTNASLESSPCVLNSDNREKDRLPSCVNNKNEPINNEIQSTQIVPEHSVSKPDQSVAQPALGLPLSQAPCQSQPQPVVSTLSKPPQTLHHPHVHPQSSMLQQQPQPIQQQAPQTQQQQLQPQPQRPPKQSRGAQSQAAAVATAQSNSIKTTQQQQQGPAKQVSPPNHGKQNQSQQKAGHALLKGNQNVQSGQSHPAKGPSPASVQKGSTPHSLQQQPLQQLQSQSQPQLQLHSQPQTQSHFQPQPQLQQQSPPTQPQQSLPQTKQQPKLPAETIQQTSRPMPQPPQMAQPALQFQAPVQPQQQGQPLKGQGALQTQGVPQNQQKMPPQGQGYRGSSPQQQGVPQQGGSRRLSNEQMPPPSVPVKPIEKRPSPPLEQMSTESIEVVKDVSMKQGGSKNSSPSPVPSAAKKEPAPEPTQSSGKFGITCMNILFQMIG